MRRGIHVGIGLVCAVLVAAHVHAGERISHGLIVKFRNPSLPESIALTATRTRAVGGRESGAAKTRRVLAAAGMRGARVRAVGRAAQRLDFGYTLTGREAARLADRLRAQPDVDWVVPNEIERRLQVPNDPRFVDGRQWWLNSVSGSNANQLSDRLRGVPGFQTVWVSTGVVGIPAAVVAVLDTGITDHPDLNANVLPGYDFVSTVEYANDGDGFDADPSDLGDWVSDADKTDNPVLFSGCDVERSSWHGTSIAGIVAAVTNNGISIAAASWDGRVLPVRVAGKCGATVSDIIDGMRWAAGLHVAGVPDNPPDNQARVVNISFGGDGSCNAAYQDAIDELAARGVVVVAAAGNDHIGATRPANCRGVIGVAALNRDGFKTTYSNFGPELTIATVGGDSASEGVWGPWLGDPGIQTISNNGLEKPGVPVEHRLFGTSYAAPIVAGVISLMLSANPNLTAKQIVDGLKKTARPHVTSPTIGACSNANPGRCICSTNTCGAGILDAEQAVKYAQDPVTYVAANRMPEVIDNMDVNAAVNRGQDQPENVIPPVVVNTSGGGALGLAWLLALSLVVGMVSWLGRQRT